MLNMKKKTTKTALKAFLAASAIVAMGTLSAWAGDDPLGDLAANGDSVGTLPATSGGHGVVIGQDTGSQDADHGVERNGASFYLRMQQSQIHRAITSATGEGYVLMVPLGKGLVRAEFHGVITLIMDEAMLLAADAEMGLVTEGTAPVLIGLQLDSLSDRPIAMPGSTTVAIPVLDLMESGQFGVQEMIIESFQAPFRPSQARITRGAGVLIVDQTSF